MFSSFLHFLYFLVDLFEVLKILKLTLWALRPLGVDILFSVAIVPTIFHLLLVYTSFIFEASLVQIYVWSVKTGRLLDVLSGHEGPVHGLSFSPTSVSKLTLESYHLLLLARGTIHQL